MDRIFLPRLQARYGALVSSLVRTILVIIWHLPLLIYSRFQPDGIPDFPYGDRIGHKGFLIIFMAMVLLTLPWSIFYTWLYYNTKGSIFLVAVLRGSEIWLAYLSVGLGVSPQNLDNYWGYGLVMLLPAIIIVIIAGPRNLSRNYQRIAT